MRDHRTPRPLGEICVVEGRELMTEHPAPLRDATLARLEDDMRRERAPARRGRDLRDNRLHPTVDGVGRYDKDRLWVVRYIAEEAVVDVASTPAQSRQRRAAARVDARVNSRSSPLRSSASSANASPTS